MSVKYKLMFKVRDASWRKFDDYKSIDDPALTKYKLALKSKAFITDVKVIKIETTATEVNYT